MVWMPPESMLRALQTSLLEIEQSMVVVHPDQIRDFVQSRVNQAVHDYFTDDIRARYASRFEDLALFYHGRSAQKDVLLCLCIAKALRNLSQSPTDEPTIGALITRYMDLEGLISHLVESKAKAATGAPLPTTQAQAPKAESKSSIIIS